MPQDTVVPTEEQMKALDRWASETSKWLAAVRAWAVETSRVDPASAKRTITNPPPPPPKYP